MLETNIARKTYSVTSKNNIIAELSMALVSMPAIRILLIDKKQEGSKTI